MKQNAILETERLLLRPFQEGDEQGIFSYASIEGVGEQAGWVHHKTIEESRSVLYNLFLKNPHCYALIDKETGSIIGSFERREAPSYLKDFPSYESPVESGYILSKEYWGKGYMSEALSFFLLKWMEEGEIDIVFAKARKSNKASIAVLEKHGFRDYKIDVDVYQPALDRKEDEICFYRKLVRR